jgi:hypothetical protein
MKKLIFWFKILVGFIIPTKPTYLKKLKRFLGSNKILNIVLDTSGSNITEMDKHMSVLKFLLNKKIKLL